MNDTQRQEETTSAGTMTPELRHRYLFASGFCGGRDVVDVDPDASLGSAILTRFAHSVTAVLPHDRVKQAAERRSDASDMGIVAGSPEAIPLGEASVDVAVFFGTPAHRPKLAVVLAELRRVLKPNGLAIIGFPDHDPHGGSDDASPSGSAGITRSDREALLSATFANSWTARQRLVASSLIAAETPLGGAQGFAALADATADAGAVTAQGPYSVMLASDGELPPVQNSFFIVDGDGSRERAQWAAQDDLVKERRGHHASRQREARLQRRLKEQELQLGSAISALSNTHQELEALKASASWRALAPMRNLMTAYPGAARRLRQIAKLTYWTATGQIIRRLKASIAYRHASSRPEARVPASALAGLSPDGLPLFLERYLIERWPGHDFHTIKLAYRFAIDHSTNPIGETALLGDETTAMLAELKRLAAAGDQPLHPSVSIIIPVHNALAHTLACLLSLLSQPSRHSFEIIVADDVSTDATATAIASIGGRVRTARPERNLGFVLNCNAAAMIARGDFLVFLNNDTVTLPGWLDALITPLENDEGIGLTCSKLLNADGSLQEAGGVFWQDGSAWNYGRGADPRAYPFNFVRETDYGSGAAIAIPTARWIELGGFDEIFAPAYCEDADLAFALRARGYRTLFIPTAEVIHHEGVSHGRDDSKGIKAYQVENLKKLKAKWSAELASHFPNGETVAMATSRSRSKTKILVIDHYLPQWDRDAGSRAMDGYLRFLVANQFHVTFWPENGATDSRYGPVYQSLGIEVVYAWPGQLSFENWIAERGADFDYVMVSRPHVALHALTSLKKYTAAKLLFIGHDLHGARLRAERQISKPTVELDREIEKADAMEKAVWNAVDAIYYPSHEEAEYVSHQGIEAPARALPLFLFGEDDIVPPQTAAELRDPASPHAMFVGGFRHRPNVDGILWFCREIWPLVKDRLPTARLTIAGSEPSLEVTQLTDDSIDVTGYISDPDLDALYRSADLVVAPLRFGAGVKGKVIEALRQGLPLVLTSVAAQGIPDIDQAGVVADEPEIFAEAVVELLRPGSHRSKRVEDGQELVRRYYSVEAVRSVLAEDIPELMPVQMREGRGPGDDAPFSPRR